MLDYIVVGFGLSGLSFVEQLEYHGKSYKVYENYSQKSSRVAGGLFNPVILKRFTLAWQGCKHIEEAVPFYKNIEAKLQQSFVTRLPILRRFNSIEEQNAWFEACDKPFLNRFLSLDLIRNTNPALDIPYQFGKVEHTGRVNIEEMLSSYVRYLKTNNNFVNASFEYNKVIVKEDGVEYDGIKAKNIVFAEGFGVKSNPFFKYLPLYGNKGEYILIKSKALKLQEAIKSSIFIIPLREDVYKVGATYNDQDKSSEVTKAAREELREKLERFMHVEYEIIDQVAGIRPTVKDRKPLIGTHPEYQNIHILNGLGSRGILISPTVAKELYMSIEQRISLDQEIDIRRFDAL